MSGNASHTAYRVLARKYRPQNFSDLIGQEPMVRTLTNAFDMGRIAQAWMLTGVRGVGKTTTARILARALNYKTDSIDRPTIHLAELGEHCQAIMEGRHVDVVEMDAASHTGIDDIREIIEQVRYRPVAARYKVYIIDEVHMLSTQAFNGLLKTLEEPPPHAKFIFATTEIRKVPVTVLSRCQRFDLRRVDSAVLTQHLQKIAALEGVEADKSALAMIARAGEGSVRDCLSILDQAIAHSGTMGAAGNGAEGESGAEGGKIKIAAETVRAMLGLADKTRIISLFRAAMQGKTAEVLQQLQQLYAYGADPSVIIRELMDFNHLTTRLRFQPNLADDISLAEEERKEASLFAERLSVRVLSRNWQMLMKGLSEVENAARPLAAAEMLLIRLCHAADLPNLDEVLRALENQRQSGSAGGAAIMLNMQPSGGGQAAAEAEPQPALTEAKQAELPQRQAETPRKSVAAAEQAGIAAEAALPPAPERAETPAPKAEMTEMPQAAAAEMAAPPSEAEKAPASAEIQDSVKKNAEPLNVQALADMAERQGKPMLKYYLRECVRPVADSALRDNIYAQANAFRFQPTEQAPADIERQISDLLRAETGEYPPVQAVKAGGGATLAEEEAREKQNRLAEAEKDADVAVILQNFPHAKLVDVRLERQGEALPEINAANAESDYNDDDGEDKAELDG